MNNVTYNPSYGGAVSLEQRNKVMRNTYWLLALSLLPTVAADATPVRCGAVLRRAWVHPSGMRGHDAGDTRTPIRALR